MELRNITTFLHVAKYGSFTKAGLALGYVQSTVSIHIQQLEKEVGTHLFERIGNRVTLTSYGVKFLEYALKIEQVVEQSKLLGKRPAEIQSKLRIGVLESLLDWLVLECIPEFYKTYPLVSIETRTASGVDLFSMLKHNELDFIFLLDQKIFEKNCIRIFSANERIVFVAAPSHELSQKNSVVLNQLLDYPLVLTEQSSVYRQALEEWARKNNCYLEPFLEINNTSAIVRLLERGVGVSFLPEYVVRMSIAKGNLVLLPVADCPTNFCSQIFYHQDKWVSPQMEGFIQMIKQYY